MRLDGEEQEDMKCTNVWYEDGNTKMVFHPLTHAEKVQLDTEAKIQYIAMMADIDL